MRSTIPITSEFRKPRMFFASTVVSLMLTKEGMELYSLALLTADLETTGESHSERRA